MQSRQVSWETINNLGRDSDARKQSPNSSDTHKVTWLSDITEPGQAACTAITYGK